MNSDRLTLAAVIASGLISTHGIDAGGVEEKQIAEKSFRIVDALIEAEDETDENEDDENEAGTGEDSTGTDDTTGSGEEGAAATRARVTGKKK